MLNRLVAAVDAHIVHRAIVADVAAEAEIGGAGGAVAKRAISTDTIGAVAIAGVAAAAGDAADADHAVATRGHPGHRHNLAGRACAEHRAQDPADAAAAIIEPVLDRRRALLLGDAGV